MHDPIFRMLESSDSIEALNALLRAAYRPLADAGLRYAASHEDVEATKRNIEDGECHVGFFQGELVACVVLRLPRLQEAQQPGWKSNGPAWYRKPGITSFGRFAVSPKHQGKGIGAMLMDRIEARALALGFEELALDTSENADHLIRIYEKRGYRFIEYHQWEITNYRSVVMSKALAAPHL